MTSSPPTAGGASDGHDPRPGAVDADAVAAVVSVFYDRVLADPGLAGFFDAVDMSRLRAHQRSFLLAALGGPDLFTGRDLAVAHAGLGVTDDAFDRLLAHLVTALADLGATAADVAAVRERLDRARAAVVTVTTEGSCVDDDSST